jgi:hypothetical protein
MQNNPILFYAVVLMQSHIIINKVEQEAVQCPERCTMFDGIGVDESAEKMSLIQEHDKFFCSAPSQRTDARQSIILDYTAFAQFISVICFKG